MKKNNYSEKLKNPLWQKKRLQVLERDNFTCVLCQDDKTTLHIHHLSYSGNPWEVEKDQLITLCEHCHQLVELKEFDIEFNACVLKFCLGDVIFLFAFDIQHKIYAYSICENKIEHLIGISNRSLKTLVHFIMDYWLKNDLETNLVDYKKAS